MKKIFKILLAVALLALIIFNLQFVDFSALFTNDKSFIALISVIASLCALALLAILEISRKIMQHKK